MGGSFSTGPLFLLVALIAGKALWGFVRRRLLDPEHFQIPSIVAYVRYQGPASAQAGSAETLVEFELVNMDARAIQIDQITVADLCVPRLPADLRCQLSEPGAFLLSPWGTRRLEAIAVPAPGQQTPSLSHDGESVDLSATLALTYRVPGAGLRMRERLMMVRCSGRPAGYRSDSIRSKV